MCGRQSRHTRTLSTRTHTHIHSHTLAHTCVASLLELGLALACVLGLTMSKTVYAPTPSHCLPCVCVSASVCECAYTMGQGPTYPTRSLSRPPHPASAALARQSSLYVIFTSLCLGVGLNTIFIGSPHGQMTREKGASVEGAMRGGGGVAAGLGVELGKGNGSHFSQLTSQ